MHPITNPSERFSLLYQETFDRLSQYVLLKAGSLSDAEDVVSAVYAAYYERVILRGRRPPDHAYAYLKRMANHELGQIYRLRRNQQSLDADWPEAESGLPDEPDSLEAFFEQLDGRELWEGIRQLSEAEQQVIVAHLRFDLTFRAIAEAMNQTESAVKLRYYRALDKLRKQFSG